MQVYIEFAGEERKPDMFQPNTRTIYILSNYNDY